MANMDFNVQVWRMGKEGSVSLRISAASAEAAKAAAEASGWIVEGITETGGLSTPEPDATLNSLRDELRGLRERIDALHAAPAIRHLMWNVFLAVIGALIAWTVGWFILSGLASR